MSVYVYNIIIMSDQMYSVKEVANKLGFDPAHIRRLLGKGLIHGRKLGRDWVVLSLDYKRKRKPKGDKGRYLS
jgi:hypothetical protein